MEQARRGLTRSDSAENRGDLMACNTSGSIRIALTNQEVLSSQKRLTLMFRWYRDAAKCYVFLSDVPRTDVDITDMHRSTAQVRIEQQKFGEFFKVPRKF
jgi:hypothetical protein